jgi:hypothetical protein
MKKVDDEKLLEMLGQGIQQKLIAKHFGCAESYITKRKKQLQAADIEEPPTFATLTDKEKKFVIAKVEGKTNTQAAQAAYEVTSLDSSKSLGHTMMQNPKIQKSIAEIMNLNGLTKENRITLLSKWAHCKDGNISLKALDQSWKLDGSYAPLQIDVESKITEDMLTVFLIKENETLKQKIKELEAREKVKAIDCFEVKEITVVTSAGAN